MHGESGLESEPAHDEQQTGRDGPNSKQVARPKGAAMSPMNREREQSEQRQANVVSVLPPAEAAMRVGTSKYPPDDRPSKREEPPRSQQENPEGDRHGREASNAHRSGSIPAHPTYRRSAAAASANR
jgi:hypothetical protein